METEIPWVYVAMIVIYFIAWVLKQIKNLTGGNQEEPEEELPPARTLAEVEENRERHLKRQAKAQSESEDPSEALRKLFESITGEVEEPEESFLPDPEPVSKQPPPLKKSKIPPPLEPLAKKSDSETLSPAEQKALKKLETDSSLGILTQKKRKSYDLHSMIRGSGLRQAVVLKEILDEPRALRPY